MVHAYGRRYAPLLMARPPFWKMLIWIGVLGFGPFYAVAVYAFVRGREWIRTPAIFLSGLMVTDVLVILSQEHSGQWATPHFGIVLALNLPWLLLPVAVLVRIAVAPPHPAGGGGLPAAGDAPGTLPAERVMEVVLASLGREVVVPGRVNALAVLLGRLAPRQVTIAVTAAGELGLGSTPAAAAPAGPDAC